MSTIKISYRNWRSKLRNEPKQGSKNVWGSRQHDSGLNAKIAEDLDYRKEKEEILDYVCEKTLELRVNDVLICNYRIDFVAVLPDGTVQLIEGKGNLFANAQLSRFKWNLLQAIKDDMYPNGVEMIMITG